jgi:hypothetical protein
MTRLKNHLRDKFLAGALAAVPVVVAVWGALLVEQYTRPLAQQVGRQKRDIANILLICYVPLSVRHSALRTREPCHPCSARETPFP